MRLCVVGLGYIGLPTATLFADVGVDVLGVDVAADKVRAVAGGRAPFPEPGLPELVARVVTQGRLTTSLTVEASDAFIISVPTPLGANGEPDLVAVRAAARSVGAALRPGNLVVVESTVPPGTTSGLVRQTLEDVSGQRAGKGFHLAYCPERAIPGQTLREMVYNDRLVGGIDQASVDAALALYRRVVKGQLLPSDVLTCELAKVAENSYRDVNIALANELAHICEKVGANAWEVISLANRHPRVNIHLPGPGVGGHCLPKDPWFLAKAAPDQAGMLPLARHINDEQPHRVVSHTLDMLRAAGLSEPAQVAVLGAAYRGGVDDVRETPTIPIITGLVEAGASVRLCDPYVERFQVPVLPYETAIEGVDLLLVVTDHPEFKKLSAVHARLLMRGRLVYDTRNVIDRETWTAEGFTVDTVGVGR